MRLALSLFVTLAFVASASAQDQPVGFGPYRFGMTSAEVVALGPGGETIVVGGMPFMVIRHYASGPTGGLVRIHLRAWADVSEIDQCAPAFGATVGELVQTFGPFDPEGEWGPSADIQEVTIANGIVLRARVWNPQERAAQVIWRSKGAVAEMLATDVGGGEVDCQLDVRVGVPGSDADPTS